MEMGILAYNVKILGLLLSYKPVMNECDYLIVNVTNACRIVEYSPGGLEPQINQDKIMNCVLSPCFYFSDFLNYSP